MGLKNKEDLGMSYGTLCGGGGGTKGSMTNHAFILERDAY
jgi:hypothetical protein